MFKTVFFHTCFMLRTDEECKEYKWSYANVHGSIISTEVGISSYEHCRSLCLEHVDCNVFTFDSDTHQCFLLPDVSLSSGINMLQISGPKKCLKCFENNIWFMFHGSRILVKFEQSTMMRCLKECNEHPECEHFTFQKSTQICTLSYGKRRRRKNMDYVSGNANCKNY